MIQPVCGLWSRRLRGNQVCVLPHSQMIRGLCSRVARYRPLSEEIRLTQQLVCQVSSDRCVSEDKEQEREPCTLVRLDDNLSLSSSDSLHLHDVVRQVNPNMLAEFSFPSLPLLSSALTRGDCSKTRREPPKLSLDTWSNTSAAA